MLCLPRRAAGGVDSGNSLLLTLSSYDLYISQQLTFAVTTHPLLAARLPAPGANRSSIALLFVWWRLS